MPCAWPVVPRQFVPQAILVLQELVLWRGTRMMMAKSLPAGWPGGQPVSESTALLWWAGLVTREGEGGCSKKERRRESRGQRTQGRSPCVPVQQASQDEASRPPWFGSLAKNTTGNTPAYFDRCEQRRSDSGGLGVLHPTPICRVAAAAGRDATRSRAGINRCLYPCSRLSAVPQTPAG